MRPLQRAFMFRNLLRGFLAAAVFAGLLGALWQPLAWLGALIGLIIYLGLVFAPD